MKNFFLAALLLCSYCLHSFGQQINSISVYDTLFVTTAVELGPDGAINYSYSLQNLPDGYTILFNDAAHSKKIMEGELVNGKFEGEWLFYQNGILFRKSQYQYGALNGPNFLLSIDGSIIQESNFIDGIMEGDLYIYHPNGIVSTHCTVLQGVAANCSQFDINGNSIQ